MELTDPQVFERLTGLAFFWPTGAGSAVHLGNVTMLRCDYALQSVDIMRSRRGIVSPRKRHFFGRSPTFTIETNQFPTALQAFHVAGTRVDDTSRTPVSGATTVFTADAGGAFDLGQGNLRNVVVKVGSDVKVIDYDYYLDAVNGWIWLPHKNGTIVDGNIVAATFDYLAQSLETYTAFDTLSKAGRLTVFNEDEYGPPAREKWVMDVELCVRSMADTDPAQFRSGVFEAAIYGEPTVYKRSESRSFYEIVLADGTILDLS